METPTSVPLPDLHTAAGGVAVQEEGTGAATAAAAAAVTEEGGESEEEALTRHVWPVPAIVNEATLEQSIETFLTDQERGFVRYVMGERPSVHVFPELEAERKEAIVERVLKDQAEQLARLPNPPALIPSHVRKKMVLKLGEITYGVRNRDGVGRMLVTHNVLCMSKLVYNKQARRGMHHALHQRIKKYPRIPPPDLASRAGRRQRPRLERAQLEVEREHVSRAARVVSSHTRALEPTAEVIAKVRELFPATDETGAFRRNVRAGATPKVETQSVLKAVSGIKQETSAGLTGMTKEVVQCLVNTDEGLEYVRLLVEEIWAGHSPSMSLVSMGSGLALAKPNGGIRPIVIPGVLYRVLERVVLGLMQAPGKLAPIQLGVGTPGGTELIVHAVNGVLAAHADPNSSCPFTHLTTLDMSNAFNTVSRAVIAETIHQTDVESYNAVRTLLGQPSEVVFATQGGAVESVRIHTGVRQGSVLSPLLFSVGLKARVEALSEWLKRGPGGQPRDAQAMFYLDDGIVLSRGAILPDLLEAWDTLCPERDDGMRLNASKCRSRTLDEVMQEGVVLLGAPVGGVDFRRQHMEQAVDELAGTYASMLAGEEGVLSKQSALLIVRMAISRRLHHLMRTMDPTGVEDLYQRADRTTWDVIRGLRARRFASTEAERSREDRIFALPLSQGGLGLTSMHTVHEGARTASVTAALGAITKRFNLGDTVRTHLRHLEGSEIVRRHGVRGLQRRLTGKAHKDSMEELLQEMSEEEGTAFVDGANSLATGWVTLFPSPRGLSLDQRTIEAGLCALTQTTAARTCGACQHTVDDAEHFETCGSAGQSRHYRHKRVLGALAQLMEAAGTTTRTEVPIETNTGCRLGRMRADLVLSTGDLSPRVLKRLQGWFDTTVISMYGKKARGHLQQARARMAPGEGPPVTRTTRAAGPERETREARGARGEAAPGADGGGERPITGEGPNRRERDEAEEHGGGGGTGAPPSAGPEHGSAPTAATAGNATGTARTVDPPPPPAPSAPSPTPPAPRTREELYRASILSVLEERERAKLSKYRLSRHPVQGLALSTKGTMSATLRKMLDGARQAMDSQPRIKASVLHRWRQQLAITLLLSRVYHHS